MSILESREGADQAHSANRAATERPSLLVFGLATSGPCRRADGFLAQVLQRRSNHETFRILRVEANARPDLLARFAVTEIPTLLVLVDGEVRARLSNPRGCSVISDLLAPWLR